MTNEQRQHKRIQKRLTMQFCLADVFPREWDMSVVENISLGGVKFVSSYDLKLINQIIRLQIKLPELSPRPLKLEAIVLSAKQRENSKNFDVRAKFINIDDADKKDLSVLETIIALYDIKKSQKK